MLATGGIMANEVFVTCIQPLREGDEPYAVSFAVPMNAAGLKILSRKSYEESATSVFDNPLASRFDENDAVLYFDDVKVPWERVFINQDIAMCQRQFHATPAHVYQNYQAQIRLMVKMRFLVGIARRIAETNGVIDFPQVRETLGALAAQNTMVDALVHAMEVKGRMHGAYFVPDAHTLYSAQVLTQQLYAEVILALRELAGGGLIMLPSSVQDFADPELRNLIEKTQQSPVTSSEGRVKFFKLAWDAVGSEFASRHSQYEMFYAGASLRDQGAQLPHVRLGPLHAARRPHAGQLFAGRRGPSSPLGPLLEVCHADPQGTQGIPRRRHDGRGLAYAAWLPARHRAEDPGRPARRGRQDGQPDAAAAICTGRLHDDAVRA